MKFLMMIIAFIFCSFNAFGLDHKHTPFDNLLKKYVSNGMVNYKGFQADQKKVKSYLASLSDFSMSEYKSFSNNQKKAF